MNEFNEYVRECFSVVGDIVIKSMMGGYLVYLNGKLIGDIGDKELRNWGRVYGELQIMYEGRLPE